jgi:hypothetical protein
VAAVDGLFEMGAPATRSGGSLSAVPASITDDQRAETGVDFVPEPEDAQEA